jgi:hypothetical protein
MELIASSVVLYVNGKNLWKMWLTPAKNFWGIAIAQTQVGTPKIAGEQFKVDHWQPAVNTW